MNEWYYNLIRPPFTPPSWIFTPAWSILYALIILSLIIYAYKTTDKDKSKGYWIFALQVLFNVLWSPVFFGMKNIWLALIIIVILDVLVFINIKEFYKVSKISAWLLVPYMIWILFATYLNIGFLILN